MVPAVCLCVPGGAGIEGTISTTEYLWCAIVISVLGSLMFLGIFFFNKERVPYEAERVSLKDMFGIIKTTNICFWWSQAIFWALPVRAQWPFRRKRQTQFSAAQTKS